MKIDRGALALILLLALVMESIGMEKQEAINYPSARREAVIDDFFGTKVSDPYRWMENPAAPDTQAWVEAENQITQSYLEKIPSRPEIEKRLTTMWDFPKYGVPTKEGGRYFFSKNDGLQNQSVLYWQKSLDSDPQVLLDPNKLSEDGTAALTNQAFTNDGKYLAYGISRHGSDWQEIKIRNVETGEDFADAIQWCKFAGIAWKHDNSGFFYNRFPEPGDKPLEAQNFYNKVFWHKLGTPQSGDVLVYERPDKKDFTFSPFLTEDGKYLILYVHYSDYASNRIYCREVESGAPFQLLLDEGDAQYDFVGNAGPVFYILTDKDAPRSRIVAIDIHHPEKESWKEILPQQEDILSSAAIVNHQLAVNFLKDAHDVLKMYTLEGKFLREIEMPAVGSLGGISGKEDDPEMFFAFTSFLYPTTIYRYLIDQNELSVFRQPEVQFDFSNYETKQVFYHSKDGTRIPLFITHKKGLTLDGGNPTLLYGYGGFDISMTPGFSLSRLIWLEQGGIYAVAVLRGGGEYGREWHQAGMFEKKQNVFDDFIAAGEWLVENKYTNPAKLAINGGSNGGLLVAACLLQRSDLFGAVVCQVPVTDMLRFQKFTVGQFWTGEYGDAEKSAEQFRYLFKYSPLHNVKTCVEYPPLLITCADTDDRVAPAHSKKFAATLQANAIGVNPILLRVDTKAGHGAGKPTAKVIEEQSDIYAFLFKQFDMEMN
ncbi:MAG: prolyl oligopeptidase family serine peptidase [Candidatus Omnitrophota bacterium]